MKIALAADHGGYALKEELKKHLEKRGIEYEDLGTYSTESVDYPDYALKAAEAVAAGKFDFGIVVCGTGIGMSIAANKVKGVRAALCNDCYSAAKARQHNNANVLCMGARVLGPGLAQEIMEAYLNASFLGSYHEGRVEKIMALEK